MKPRGWCVRCFKNNPGVSSSTSSSGDQRDTLPEATHLGQKWVSCRFIPHLRLQPGARPRPAGFANKVL